MKRIKIPYIHFGKSRPPLAAGAAWLDAGMTPVTIGEVPWPKFSYRPEVSFVAAYSDNEIFLKYMIREQNIRATRVKTNETVCKDSCVEFFISPADADGTYFNFEFNCIGTCLVGHGTCREGRALLNPGVVDGIERLSTLGSTPFTEKRGDFTWEITCAIPLDIFSGSDLSKPSGKRFKANFYKCGDDLSVPHYITWNPIKIENPDFHRPDFFGEIEFLE